MKRTKFIFCLLITIQTVSLSAQWGAATGNCHEVPDPIYEDCKLVFDLIDFDSYLPCEQLSPNGDIYFSPAFNIILLPEEVDVSSVYLLINALDVHGEKVLLSDEDEIEPKEFISSGNFDYEGMNKHGKAYVFVDSIFWFKLHPTENQTGPYTIQYTVASTELLPSSLDVFGEHDLEVGNCSDDPSPPTLQFNPVMEETFSESIENIDLFPSLAQDHIILNSKRFLSNEIVVRIYNSSGELVLTKHVASGHIRHQIDIQDLKDDVYLVHLLDKKGITVMKFQKRNR